VAGCSKVTLEPSLLQTEQPNSLSLSSFGSCPVSSAISANDNKHQENNSNSGLLATRWKQGKSLKVV